MPAQASGRFKHLFQDYGRFQRGELPGHLIGTYKLKLGIPLPIPAHGLRIDRVTVQLMDHERILGEAGANNLLATATLRLIVSQDQAKWIIDRMKKRERKTW